jgi:hypothetical protein
MTMRIFLILPFFLILILSNLQRTAGTDCRCECCTSDNCRPTIVGIHSLWYCSEASTCKQANCIDWHYTQCPPQGLPGQTRAICISNAERILPISFVIIGINLIILLIKDKGNFHL